MEIRAGKAEQDAEAVMLASASAPALDQHIIERNQWLETMADYELQTERKYESLNRRIGKLERRHGGLFDMPEEMKGFLVMLALYVGVTVVLPELAALVRKWQQSR